MLKIVGAKGNISNVDKFLKKVESFAKSKNIVIQAFNADMIFGKNHIVSAYEHATRSIKNKKNTTNSLEMELLLYSSGERQLKLAIPKMGVKNGRGGIVFVLIGNNISSIIIDELLSFFSLEKDNKLIDGNVDTLIQFGLKDEEIKTVKKDKYENLILEKVALVDIIK